MKLVCPSCGATASADSWINDATCRETLAVISRLPSPLPKTCLGYLSLFRPGKNALGWKKALRLALEIEQLAKCGYVSVQGRVDKNCTAGIWAQAMEAMLDQRTGLKLPMPNHRYLEKVAHDLADQADYLQEKKSYKSKPVAGVRGNKGDTPVSLLKILSPMDAYIQGTRDTKPTDAEMQAFARKGLE
jgi:hypothetical protein